MRHALQALEREGINLTEIEARVLGTDRDKSETHPDGKAKQ